MLIKVRKIAVFVTTTVKVNFQIIGNDKVYTYNRLPLVGVENQQHSFVFLSLTQLWRGEN